MANLNGIPLRFGSGIIYVFQIITVHKDPVRELCDPFGIAIVFKWQQYVNAPSETLVTLVGI